MKPQPSREPNARQTPPDPGGRGRYLILTIAIACLVGVALAVVLLFALYEKAQPATPRQQRGGMAHGVVPRTVACDPAREG